jgi:hypothetical protein
VKPLDTFPPVRRGEAKLQSWCRDCFAAYGIDYYRKNREAQKARLLRNASIRRADNRMRAIEYLRAHIRASTAAKPTSSFSNSITSAIRRRM